MSFYGSETRFPPKETVLPGVRTPQELYRALLRCWCAETCTPRMRADWSEENPSLGQCSVTAFLAQELFGGEVYGVPLPDGGVHCFNLAEGRIFDLSSEQFRGEKLVYTTDHPQSREECFARRERYERFLLLRERLWALTGGRSDV